MWMDGYLQDTLIHDQIAAAQARATRDHLLRGAQPHATRRLARLVARFLHTVIDRHRACGVAPRLPTARRS